MEEAGSDTNGPRRQGHAAEVSGETLAPAAAVGEALVVFLGAVPLFVALGWLCGSPLSPLALLPAAALAAWTAPAGRRVATLVPAGSVLTAALVASLAFLDVSFDGPLYHLPAVRALAEGWNPVLDPPLDRGRPGEVFANLYPKAGWATGAVFATATGRMESAKAISLAWLLAVLLLVHGTLRPATRSRALAGALAALVALNPVAIVQVFATTVDGVLASVVTAALVLGVRLARAFTRGTAAAFALSLVALCGLKLSGAAFALFVGAGALGLAALRGRRPACRTAALLGAAALTAVVAGWSPYVTNALRYGHPAHPVLGPHRVEVERGQASADFRERGSTARLAASLLAESSNEQTRPRLRLPFLFSPRELRAFASGDVRFGGFGPLFSGALLVSLPLLAALLLREGPRRAPAIVLLAAVAGMIAINPEAWWARLAPQTWLVPAGTSVLGALSVSRRARCAAGLLALLLLADAALVAAPHLFGQAVFTAALRSQLDGLRAAAAREGPLLVRLNSFEGVAWRLEERRVPFREVESFGGRPSVRIAFSNAEAAAASGGPLPEARSAAGIAAAALSRIGLDGSAVGLPPP